MFSQIEADRFCLSAATEGTRWAKSQESNKSTISKPTTEFAQHRLSRSSGGHLQQEGANLGVFAPMWLVLPRCEATNLGVFDLCHFALLKRGCANSVVGLELAEEEAIKGQFPNPILKVRKETEYPKVKCSFPPP